MLTFRSTNGPQAALVAAGLVASGLVASGLVASGLVASGWNYVHCLQLEQWNSPLVGPSCSLARAVELSSSWSFMFTASS